MTQEGKNAKPSYTASFVLFGPDNKLSNLLAQSIVGIEMQFSQKQEQDADLFALELLKKTYGHVGGGTSFLNRLAQNEKKEGWINFFATHPHPANRVRTLNREINKRGYRIKNMKTFTYKQDPRPVSQNE